MNRRYLRLAVLFLLLFCAGNPAQAKAPLVLLTDFGLKDGAVSAMQGVAVSVDPDIRLFNLTHEIPAYNIWEASYRLMQTAPFWPAGTVFVAVVDPGVGGERKSVVLKTRTGHYFVSPDNGTLTLVAEKMGLQEVRQIDESTNRLAGSQDSYTFFGRDLYASTGARIASGVLAFEEVGPVLLQQLVTISYQKVTGADGKILGAIPVLDAQYGNVWTNINQRDLAALAVQPGDLLTVEIFQRHKRVYQGEIPFANTFSDVPAGRPLAYYNSLMDLSFALNMKSFAAFYNVGSGPEWSVRVEKITRKY